MLFTRRWKLLAAILGVAFLGACLLGQSSPASAAAATTTLQSQLDSQDQQIAALNQQIAQYEVEIQQAGANKATLQNAINTLNLQRSKIETQISATQHQINATQLQIQQLSSGIQTTQEQIATSQEGLAENIRSLAQNETQPLMVQLISSTSLGEAWDDVSTDAELQNAIASKVEQLSGQETSLAASQAASKQKQSTLTAQKQQLTSQSQQLVQTKQQKTQLLTQTNAQESMYEKLLATAQAELQSFSTFAQNAGGKGILYDQTSCDSWGCYYNQRDSQWGNDALDGTSYTMKSDGCLVTAMAMVMTHYGYSGVTPVTINSNPSDFAAYYPADFLVNNVPIAGATVSRISVGTRTANIDAALATGNPLVVGIHAYGGTHYIVFVSGSKGSYLMRDPYQPSAKDVPFTKYYSLSDIFYTAKVSIS